MAVAFSRYVDGTASAGSTTAEVDLAACSVGDLAFVLISRANTNTPDTVPGGWSLLQSHSSTQAKFLYYKVLEAADIATRTWSGYASSVRTLAHASVYTGACLVSSAKGNFVTASGTAIDCGSITSNETWLAQFGTAYSTSAKTFNALAGYTERRDNGGTTPDMWHLLADTNNTWGGGACAPDFVVSAASTYCGGFIVELRAKKAMTASAGAATATADAATLRKPPMSPAHADATAEVGTTPMSQYFVYTIVAAGQAEG